MTNASMTFTQTGPDPLISGMWRDLDANGFKITDLGAAVADTDAVNKAFMVSYIVTQLASLVNAALAAANYLDKAGGTMTGPIVLSADPLTPLQAATKSYVDSVAAGLDIKASCRLATQSNDTLSGLAVRDGVTPISGDRVLVMNQSTASQNGIYVAAAGAWTRSTDMDNWSEVPGANVWVEEGTISGDRAYVCTSNIGGTIGTTAIVWTVFGGSGVYQAANANLAALAGLTLAANQLPYATAAGALSLTTLSVFIRGLLDDADGPTACGTIGAETVGAIKGINTQTANYTVVLADAGKMVEMNVAGANTLTIPPNSTAAFPIGTYLNIEQYGAGQTTVTAGAGVTIRSAAGLKIAAQYGTATIVKRGTDEWVLSGTTSV